MQMQRSQDEMDAIREMLAKPLPAATSIPCKPISCRAGEPIRPEGWFPTFDAKPNSRAARRRAARGRS